MRSCWSARSAVMSSRRTSSATLSPSTGNVFVFPADQAYAAYLVALVAITLGVLVWDRRPDSRTGILLIAFPLAGVLADPIVFPGSRLAVTVGLAAVWLNAAIAAHLILSYPTGRFIGARARLRRSRVRVRVRLRAPVAALLRPACSARSRRLGVLLLRAAAHARGLARRNRRETRARRSPCRVDRPLHGAPSAQDHPRCAGGAERRAAARGRGLLRSSRFGFLIGFRTFAPSSDIMELGLVLVGDVRHARDLGRARREHAVGRRRARGRRRPRRRAGADAAGVGAGGAGEGARRSLARACALAARARGVRRPPRAASRAAAGGIRPSGDGARPAELRSRRSCTTPRCSSGRGCSRRRARRHGWRSRTSGCRRSCARSWWS